jgi:hypothetical protein
MRKSQTSHFYINLFYLWLLKKYCSVYSRCYATIVRWAVISEPFLGNGSVNTSPRQRLRIQRGKGVLSTRSVPRSHKEENWGNQLSCYLTVNTARDMNTETKEQPLLEAVIRKGLVAGWRRLSV